MQAQFRSGLATVSAVEERRNEWHDVDTWEATRRIADLSEDARLQQLMLFICVSLIGEPERVRRLLSHTGAIDGIDHGNIVYYIVYRSLLDQGNNIHPALNHARTFTQPNNCGNLIEAVLAMAHLIPRLFHGQEEPETIFRNLELVLRLETWATEMDVHRARDYVLEVSQIWLFHVNDFIRPLEELVCLVSACVHQLPCRCLFQHLTKRSTQQEMQQALDELEAIRLVWPEATYNLPGRTPTPWGESSCFQIELASSVSFS